MSGNSEQINKAKVKLKEDAEAPSPAQIQLKKLCDYLRARTDKEGYSTMEYWIKCRNLFYCPGMTVFYDLKSSLTKEVLRMKISWEVIARFNLEQNSSGTSWQHWQPAGITESHVLDDSGKVQEYFIRSCPGAFNYGIYMLNVEQMEQDAAAVRITGLEEKYDGANFGQDRYAQSKLVHRVVPNSCLSFLPKGALSEVPRADFVQDLRLHRTAEVHTDFEFSLMLNSDLQLTIFHGIFHDFKVVYSEDLVQHLHDVVCEANGVCPPVQVDSIATFLYQIDHPEKEAIYTPDSTATRIHLAVLNILQKHCPVNDFGVTSRMMRIMELVQVTEPLSKVIKFQEAHSDVSPRDAFTKLQHSN